LELFYIAHIGLIRSYYFSARPKSIDLSIEDYVQHSFTVEGVNITVKPSALSLDRFEGKLLLGGKLELL
jgi:hypothetical protein